jgi:hypothetical protein
MQFATLFSLASAIVLTGVKAQSNTVPVTGVCEHLPLKYDKLTSASQILGNATTVTNPKGPVYTAVLPTTEYFNPSDPRGNVKGSVSITAAPNGIGVSIQVSFSNFPTSGGPFRKYYCFRALESKINVY